MGFLNDFFLTTPERAAEIDPASWDAVEHDFPVLPSGHIEPTVMFGMLEQVMIGTPFEVAMKAETRFGEGGECWVYAFRDELQQALIADDVDWFEVGQRWVATGDVDMPADGATELLEELATFIRSGSADDRLYVWCSL